MRGLDTTRHDPREVLTEREAAAALGISYPTLTRYRRERRPLVAFFQPSPRRFCYLRSDVEAARRRRRTPEAGEAEVEAAVAEVEGAVVEG